MYYNGHAKMVVNGMSGPVYVLQEVDYNWRAKIVAHGIH